MAEDSNSKEVDDEMLETPNKTSETTNEAPITPNVTLATRTDTPETPTPSLIERLKQKQEGRQKLFMNTSEFQRVCPKNYATLPTCILYSIFQFLDTNFVTQQVSMVCRHWRRAVQQEGIIKHLFVRRNEVPLHYIFDHLRKYKPLDGLYLVNNPNTKAILMQAQKFSKTLKHLTLKNYREFDGRLLNYALKVFPLLESLSLESSSIELKEDLSTFINKIYKLKGLNMSNIKAPNVSVHTILQIALNCRSLEKLNIGLLPPMVQLIDEDACLIISNMEPRLKFLAIDSRSLTSRTFERLKKCPKLTAIYINFAINFTGAFFIDFWSEVAEDVEEMGFTHNCIVTGENVKELFTLRGNVFAKLTHLDFTYCPLLNDVAVEAIASRCRDLKCICLKLCINITNIDAFYRKCASLRRLNVAYCHHLRASLKLPKSLSTLIIDDKSGFLYLVRSKKIYARFSSLKVLLALSEFTDDLRKI